MSTALSSSRSLPDLPPSPMVSYTSGIHDAIRGVTIHLRKAYSPDCVEQEFSEVHGSNLRASTPRDGEYRLANTIKCSYAGECCYKGSEEA